MNKKAKELQRLRSMSEAAIEALSKDFIASGQWTPSYPSACGHSFYTPINQFEGIVSRPLDGKVNTYGWR